jgi:TATA-binding protein-associated factor Taf7
MRCPAGANPRVGKLKVDGVEHAVYLQDMPTVVESYKTLDDANLVKVADLGQVGASLCCLLGLAVMIPACVDDGAIRDDAVQGKYTHAFVIRYAGHMWRSSV